MPDITFRQATVADAPEMAVVHRRSSFLPVMNTPEEDLAFFRDREFARSLIWVAEVDQRIVGLLAREGEWVHHFYVLPEFQGIGIGSQLMAKAKLESPNGLRLYTYQGNHRARAFYEARGFTNVEFNDAGREEGRPDVLMEMSSWSGGKQHEDLRLHCLSWLLVAVIAIVLGIFGLAIIVGLIQLATE